MGRLTIDNFSDELVEYLDTLGLTEEQVNEIIKQVSGDKAQLTTEDKSSLVAAINELNSRIGNNSIDIAEVYNDIIDEL